MSKVTERESKPTLEELQSQLSEAVGQLGAAFTNGEDGEIPELTARIRAIEKQILDGYYSRWGIP